MKTILSILAALAVLACAAGTAPAQEPAPGQFLVPIPEKLERATTTDDDGVLQWAEYEAERCVNCKGQKWMPCLHCQRFDEGDCEDCPECHNTKKAVCRICAGTGEMPDILERAPCPSCFGASITRCFVCNGRGQFPVAGGGDRLQKCGCCDGKGGYACQTCDGQRWVETPKLKPSVGEAKLKDLRKALETLDKVAEAVAGFESVGDGRKDIKTYSKALAPAARYFPPLRRAQKHFEGSTKDQTKGAVWKHYADTVKASAEAAKQSLEYYLKHQRQLLGLCIARAEVNEGDDGKK